MQRLEVSGAVRSLYGSLGVKGSINLSQENYFEIILSEYSIYVLGRVLGISCMKAIRRHNEIESSELHKLTISQKQEILIPAELLMNNPAAMDSLSSFRATVKLQVQCCYFYSFNGSHDSSVRSPAEANMFSSLKYPVGLSGPKDLLFNGAFLVGKPAGA